MSNKAVECLDVKSFEAVVLNILKTLYIKFVRYIDIDSFAQDVGKLRNINLISLFDCCREIKTKSSKEGNAEETGMSHTFYAAADGKLASAGNATDMLSPTTASWLYFLMANKGALYPMVLSEMQWAILNGCD